MNDIKNICVYSASSTKIDPIYFEAAEELGKILAQKHINLINGAGCLGLMCRISDAALAAGGTVTGVIPRFMVEQGWHHKGLTRLIETESMHERKQLIISGSYRLRRHFPRHCDVSTRAEHPYRPRFLPRDSLSTGSSPSGKRNFYSESQDLRVSGGRTLALPAPAAATSWLS